MQPPTFGELLKHFRVAAGLSQEALAERARMSAHAISSLERGARRAPYRDTVALLQDALALAPADRARLDAAAEGGRKRTPRVDADAAPVDATADNLPAQLTSFVGRESEVAEIVALLAANRLVTVTGAGGIGKTRVALEVCAQTSSVWGDGITFADLAPLADGALVAARIASTAGVALSGGDPAAALAAALRGRATLFVIDNCEHVVRDVADIIAALLQSCPRLTFLATSRERLGLAGESVYRLAPLSAPSSVELFLQRSGTSTAQVEAEQLALARAICRRLDGIPLALEFAAARVPVLGLLSLRDRLNEHFKVLSRGSRAAPARQQTMQAAIAWSYELLDASERALFRRLAIFVGGWRLDAAEEVCTGDALATVDVVDDLTSLIEKSLVIVDNDGQRVRYRFLEPTRAFALDQLVISGEHAALAAAHARWMGAFADWAYEEYHHIPRRRWSEFVEPELDNAYAGLAFANGEGNDVNLAGRILAGVRGAFADSPGSLKEFGDSVKDALARIDAAEEPVLHAHLLRALMSVIGGTELIAAAHRAIELFSEIDEVFGLGRSFELLATGYIESGEFEAAMEAIERALLLYRDRGLGRSGAYMVGLDTRANVFQNLGRFDEAECDQAEALSIARLVHDDWFALHLQISRASVALTASDPERAAALAESALAESRALRTPRYEMYALLNLAGARLTLNDFNVAHEAALAALRLARYRDVISSAVSILFIATVAALQGRSRAAARLLGYVDAWAAKGFIWGTTEAACRQRLVAALDAHLPTETLAGDIVIGARFDDEAAAEEALQA